MTLGKSIAGGSALVRADGRIDESSAEAFERALMSAVAQAPHAVAVDMSGVEHISSAGLRALMNALRLARAQHKRFVLAALAPGLQEVLKIGRFHQMFDIYPAVRDALEAVSSPRLDAIGA